MILKFENLVTVGTSKDIATDDKGNIVFNMDEENTVNAINRLTNMLIDSPTSTKITFAADMLEGLMHSSKMACSRLNDDIEVLKTLGSGAADSILQRRNLESISDDDYKIYRTCCMILLAWLKINCPDCEYKSMYGTASLLTKETKDE